MTEPRQRPRPAGPPEPAAWDAASYDRISGPHAAMGASALERLELRGDERVLDAGCGSGRLTEQLLERLPDGRVVALDGSDAMLEEAARRLARFGERVTYVRADLGSPPLPVEGRVDAILSTATFHWVLDHDRLFAGLAAALRSGGQLSAQCGGQGNAVAVRDAVRAEGVETSDRFHFASAEETVERLERSGFVDARAWLAPESIAFETDEELEQYIVTPYLRPATGLPEAELLRLAKAAAARLPARRIDYVRLNLIARRA
jgi:trans-aconitate 2-methyltransferase